MSKVLLQGIVTIMVIAFYSVPVFAMGSLPEPATQATTGYGSSENYICNGFVKGWTGSWLNEQAGGTGGDQAWYFVPDQLKNGVDAPLVVLLHGQFMISWEIYDAYINHLTRQGYIVVFPQFNKTLLGLMNDADQNQFLNRAIQSTRKAIQEIQSDFGRIIDFNNVVLSAHSVGGIIATCWPAKVTELGYTDLMPDAIVMNNACIDFSAIPDFVAWMINIKQLPYETMAASVTCPVFILWGDSDEIAFESQQNDLYNALANSTSREVYTMKTQEKEGVKLSADHMAVSCNQGPFPDWIMKTAGGTGNVDTLDYRYYWNAIDAALDGRTSLQFDMGFWYEEKNGVKEPIGPIVNPMPGLPSWQ